MQLTHVCERGSRATVSHPKSEVADISTQQHKECTEHSLNPLGLQLDHTNDQKEFHFWYYVTHCPTVVTLTAALCSLNTIKSKY